MSGSHLFEKLEDRRLLSATAAVVKGILFVRGDVVSNNVITVDETTTGGTTSISVTIASTNARGVTKNFSSSFPTTGVTEVFIRGGIKNDTINVGQNSTPAFNINTRVDGLAGHDAITTAGESDTINGGFASDTISSGDGNDVVRGGLLSDQITVGNGNDKVRGGILADTIIAGNGTDTIVGGRGSDSITAGNGDDLVHASSGNDTIVAGNGADSLWGGGGNDSITGGNGTDLFGGIVGDNTLVGGTGADTYYERKGKTSNDVTPTYNPAKGDKIITVGHEPKTPTV